MLYCLVICALAVLLDQISKIIVVNTMAEGTVIEVVKGALSFTYIENTGAAFGMLSDHRWIFMVISAFAIVAIMFFLWKEKPESYFIKTTLACILGGGIGNMIDRTFRGSVVDFIDVEFFVYPEVSFRGGFSVNLADFPIFNIADCFITVGCVALMAYLIFVEFPKESKRERELTANAENAKINSATAENDVGSDANE